MRRDAGKLWLICCGMFVLFGLCGAGSAAVSFDHFPQSSLIYPLPFALLCWLAFLRRAGRVLFAIPLIMLWWYIAYYLAFAGGFAPLYQGGLLKSAISCAAGGLTGGLGLVFSASMCFRPIGRRKYYAWGAVIGVFSAAGFVKQVAEFESNVNTFVGLPIGAFAFWEAAMGTYLFAICSAVVNSAEVMAGQ